MDVGIDDKPKPAIQDPEDVIILRITSTAICGSDLHLYHGTTEGMEQGQTLGHEFAGVVEAAGGRVDEVKVGGRVVIPFNISCGKCWFCRHQLWSQCERSNPKGDTGATYGYGQMIGGYDGGQAEFVRVPFANAALKIPDNLREEQVLFLCDVLCTGYFGADMANASPATMLRCLAQGRSGILPP